MLNAQCPSPKPKAQSPKPKAQSPKTRDQRPETKAQKTKDYNQPLRSHLPGACMRLLIVWSLLVAASLVPAAAYAQANVPDGAAVFARNCASCHKPGQSEVPPPEVLRTLTTESIL